LDVDAAVRNARTPLCRILMHSAYISLICGFLGYWPVVMIREKYLSRREINKQTLWSNNYIPSGYEPALIKNHVY